MQSAGGAPETPAAAAELTDQAGELAPLAALLALAQEELGEEPGEEPLGFLAELAQEPLGSRRALPRADTVQCY